MYNPSIDWKVHKGKNPIESLVIEPAKKPQINKPLFIRAKAFIKATKQSTSFVIYATPTS